MWDVNDFAHIIGLFFVSASLFAFGTGVVGSSICDFSYDELPFVAWIVAIIVYGITFTILYEMR